MDKTASRGRSSQFRSMESNIGIKFDEEVAEDDDGSGKDSMEEWIRVRESGFFLPVVTKKKIIYTPYISYT